MILISVYSVESLSILKEALSSQFHEIALLSNDREALANTVEALKQGISRNALEQDVRLQSCEEEVQLLQAQLHEAISEKERLDQAVDSNLIEGMTQVKGELAASKREVLVLQDSYNTLLYAHNKLHEEAKAVKSELSDLKGRKEYTDQYCAKLEHSLATIEKDNVIRINEAHVKDAEIQDMADKLDKSEQKQQALQKSVHHLEGLGMMETLEIEQIKFSHKSLSSLLDERRKEIASLVEGRHKDKMRIQHLQIELNKLQESTQVVKESARSELKDLEQRLVFAEDEARTREGIMARLKERCQHLEDEVEKKGSENKRLEEQCTKLRQELEKLEEEIRNLVSGKHLGELKIKQLEDRLQNEESTRLDNNRLREKYTQSEKDRHKLESLLIQCRSEFYDEADRKTRDLVHFENRNMELEQESKIYEQRSKTISAMRDAQIARLQSELDTYIAKLEAINTRSSNAEVQLQSMEVDYATINEKCEKYRKRIINAEQELKSARDKGEKDAIESSVHLENLHRRVKVLENENAIHIQERERMYIRSQQERSDAKRLSFELEKTQGELMTIRRERSRLEQDLEERETERRSQERQLSSMKHLIHKLQSNTKERFQTLSQDSTKLVDCLKEQKERLELKLLKTESERDACTSCLDYGRERLSRFCQRGGSGELLEARFENRGKHEPFGLELYLLDCPIDQIYAVGANINRCPEASTNVLLRGCPDANLNQQSRLHSICEDEKGVVSALLDRIRYLECEIRGTPLGSSHQLD